MASRQMSIEDHVTCSICMDLYDDPMALPCMHSFCRNCLSGIVASSMVLKCPECRKYVKLGPKGVKGLARNFHLCSIVESYKHDNSEGNVIVQPEVSSQLPLCEYHRVPCQVMCKTCKKPICYVCLAEKHGGHTYELTDDSTVGKQASVEGGGICDQHSKRYLLLCQQCDIVVCLSCVVQNHQKHNFNTFEEIHRNTTESVNDSLGELDARRRLLRATNKTCRTLAQKVQKDAHQKRQELSSYFSRLRDMLDRREALVREELDKREAESVEGYLRKAEHAQKKEAQLNVVIDDVKRLLTEDKIRVIQTYKERTAGVSDLLQDESRDSPPDMKGVDGGTLQICSLDKELLNVRWNWPKEDLKPVRKAPPVPAERKSIAATKMAPQARQRLKPGCPVHRGKDWSGGMTDGGPGHFGSVVQASVEPDVYVVRWPNGKTGSYKYAPPYEEQIAPP